jgi:Zn-dependent protease with chaperone function
MDEQTFKSIVARLEEESRESPGAYRVKVALLTLLGFGLLALMMGFAGLGLVLLAGVAVLVAFTGTAGVILVLKLGKLLILLAVPLWMLLRSSLAALFSRIPAPEGRELTRAEAPALFEALDAMRARMKGPRFHHVLVTEDLNAAVVQRPLLGLFGFPRNYLLLGLPLLESLSPDEAAAVVAHEYGHLAGAHARFGAFIYRLRHTWGSIQEVVAQWNGVGGRAMGRLIGWYAPFFNAYTFALARAHEYEADAASAELVGVEAAASALKRVTIASAQHDQFLASVYSGVREHEAPPPDVADRWARSATGALPPLAARWLGESLNRQHSPFDTHPVLRARLAALPGQAECIDRVPGPLAGPSAAEAWLGPAAGPLREAHQSTWRERVAARWRERHDAIRRDRERLAALRLDPAGGVEQTIERLRLEVALEPDVDHVPALAAFNASEPDRPATLYLEGLLRLDRDDDAGLALLDRAMDLDGDAVQPGCERAFGYLTARGEHERAAAYARRYRERAAWEARRAAELRTLDPAHDYAAPALEPEDEARVRELLASEAMGRGIRSAWLARRVLPSDPGVPTYVLVLELTRWARFRSQGPKIVERVAAIEWPMHAFVCTADANAPVAKKVRAAGREFHRVR